ncbi:hypothetical protein [Mesorhizobium ciceri]|uniref:hypothetical protein n=1 Tax=Mesorhizobium TaxID=68287 RepID=UPI0012DC7A2B|nr:hypothetical protein [Mesorhizobium ciceri]
MTTEGTDDRLLADGAIDAVKRLRASLSRKTAGETGPVADLTVYVDDDKIKRAFAVVRMASSSLELGNYELFASPYPVPDDTLNDIALENEIARDDEYAAGPGDDE